MNRNWTLAQPDRQGFAVFGQLIDGFEVLDAIMGRAEEDEYLAEPVGITRVYRL